LVGLLIVIIFVLGLFPVILVIVLAFLATLTVAGPGLLVAFGLVLFIAAAILAFFILLVCLIILIAISAIIAFGVLLLLILSE